MALLAEMERALRLLRQSRTMLGAPTGACVRTLHPDRGGLPLDPPHRVALNACGYVCQALAEHMIDEWQALSGHGQGPMHAVP